MALGHLTPNFVAPFLVPYAESVAVPQPRVASGKLLLGIHRTNPYPERVVSFGLSRRFSARLRYNPFRVAKGGEVGLSQGSSLLATLG